MVPTFKLSLNKEHLYSIPDTLKTLPLLQHPVLCTGPLSPSVTLVCSHLQLLQSLAEQNEFLRTEAFMWTRLDIALTMGQAGEGACPGQWTLRAAPPLSLSLGMSPAQVPHRSCRMCPELKLMCITGSSHKPGMTEAWEEAHTAWVRTPRGAPSLTQTPLFLTSSLPTTPHAPCHHLPLWGYQPWAESPGTLSRISPPFL